ncbi:hypothetical protein DL95DRAFT_474581, partial [Leptodontidium sp. 2 PMI_412]
MVGVNLDDALREFRMRPVWTGDIDAVCVDQEDTMERMEQVKLMREIYKGAHSLTVWLGVEA